MAKYKVIISVGLRPFPASYEISAASLLAEYFRTDVEFIPRSNHKTPDFLIDGVKWELKSPTGKGRHNIRHQLQGGVQQSHCIIFDARKSKIHMTKIRHELSYQFRLSKNVQRIILIDKSKKVVELQKIV